MSARRIHALSSVAAVRMPYRGQARCPYRYIDSDDAFYRWAHVIRALVLVASSTANITPLWHAISQVIYDTCKGCGGCWQSYETIAAEVQRGVPGVRPAMRCSVKSVGRAVEALRQMGLIWTVKHYCLRDGGVVPTTNTIWLIDPTQNGGRIGTRTVRTGGHRPIERRDSSRIPLKGPADRLNKESRTLNTMSANIDAVYPKSAFKEYSRTNETNVETLDEDDMNLTLARARAQLQLLAATGVVIEPLKRPPYGSAILSFRSRK